MFSIGQKVNICWAAAATWLGYVIPLPNFARAGDRMIAAMLVGAGYGWIPGILKVKLG